MAIADVLDLLVCPVCRAPFQVETEQQATVRCARSHSFDLGHPGYLNLLGRRPPANADTAAMVRARERFLAGGHFAPLAAAVHDRVPESSTEVLDCGAGTGHYLIAVLGQGTDRRGIALDVSVAAAKQAARLPARLGAVVADVWQPLPLAAASCDVVLSIFAPRQAAEFARVLRPGGSLITITPQPEHLRELRRLLPLIAVDPAKPARLAAQLGERFDLDDTTDVTFTCELDRAAVRDLVGMGPNAFHLDAARTEDALAGWSWPVTTTLAVTVTHWRRRQ